MYRTKGWRINGENILCLTGGIHAFEQKKNAAESAYTRHPHISRPKRKMEGSGHQTYMCFTDSDINPHGISRKCFRISCVRGCDKVGG